MNLDYSKPVELISNVFDLIDGRLVVKVDKVELLKELNFYPAPKKI